MKTKLMLIFSTSVLLSACSVSNSSVESVVSMREPELFQRTAVMHYPVIAKIEIQKKISHTYYPDIKDDQCGISDKLLAYENALTKLDIDGIFEPIYYCEVFVSGNKKGRKVKTGASITVTGYPYIYKEFRDMTEEDKNFLTSPGTLWVPLIHKEFRDTTEGDKNLLTSPGTLWVPLQN
jgi:hypothetical protein